MQSLDYFMIILIVCNYDFSFAELYFDSMVWYQSQKLKPQHARQVNLQYICVVRMRRWRHPKYVYHIKYGMVSFCSVMCTELSYHIINKGGNASFLTVIFFHCKTYICVSHFTNGSNTIDMSRDGHHPTLLSQFGTTCKYHPDYPNYWKHDAQNSYAGVFDNRCRLWLRSPNHVYPEQSLFFARAFGCRPCFARP